MSVFRNQIAFRRFAWGFLGYTLLVILWGGFVRASGSGAGCGDHWPLCNGEVIPRAPALNTIIEFSHRVTSGLAGLLSVVLVVCAWKSFGRSSGVFKMSVAVFFFMMLEAAIGAGLVLFEYVAYNPSFARTYWMATHLVNTFFLLAALALTGWMADGNPGARLSSLGARGLLTLGLLILLLVLGASGAIAALGDTLSIGGNINPESNVIVGTLVGLRIYHPLLACIVFMVAILMCWTHRAELTSIGWMLLGTMVVQMLVGVVNVYLHAPIWIQIVHLLLTDAIWILAVLFYARMYPKMASA